MKIGFIITARMKSTRLPDKLTLPIEGKDAISWMVKRAKLAFKNDQIIIATSTNPQDDQLEMIGNTEKIMVYRGHEEDVISRLYDAAVKHDLDFFINITADCPLFGYDYIPEIIQLFKKTNADFITCLDLPHGIFVYGLKTESVKKVIDIKKTDQTEVWGVYFENNPHLFITEKLFIPTTKQRPDFRLTLDYPEDYLFFEAVFKHFGDDTYKLSSDQLVDFLDNHPEIVAINKDCKALYQKRWEKQKATTLEKK